MIPTLYTPDYEIAIAIILSPAVEGGYSDHPADSGGATNMGITAHSLADYNKRRGKDWTIPTLDRDQAREFYFDEYWIPMRLHEIGDQAVKNVLFATAIHTGIHTAVLNLQWIVGAKADGIIGPKTIAMINYSTASENIVNRYCDSIKDYYKDLVKRKPEKVVFIKGWTKRINSFRIA